jgi:hypothetical protein
MAAAQDRVKAERLRQAAWAFNAALAFSGLGALLVMVGIVRSLMGDVLGGGASGAGGLGSMWAGRMLLMFYRDANDRLDRMK